MSLKVLFVPVSSTKGIGEYMRSLSLAKALVEERPEIDVAFVLNQQAPYHKDCPFKTYLCPDSPTKHSRLVNKYIAEFAPRVAIFDASGRVAQLQFCKQLNIATIFICQHNKKLKKGLRWRRLANTDAIWVVQPQFALKPLSLWSRLKLKLLNKKPPLAIGPIFQTSQKAAQVKVLARFDVAKRDFVLVNAGSGGHQRGGENSAEIFAKAAAVVADKVPHKVLMVYGPNFKGNMLNHNKLVEIPQLDAESFSALLSQAKFAILAGGSALFQAAHYGTATLSCAVSKDQQERIDACERVGLTRQTPLDVNKISERALNCIATPLSVESTAVTNGLFEARRELYKIIGQ